MGLHLAVILLLSAAVAAEGNRLPSNVAKTAKAAKAAASGKKTKPVAQPPQPVPTAAQPVVPLRPSQMPSIAPRVSYQQGQLTVVAENSTIGDILSAVRNATGIRIETQGGPSGDRVAAKIGPAAPREVLLSLLQGSRYDYVMLGSLANPEMIERVILTPKMAGGGGSAPPLRTAQQPERQTDQQNDEGDFQDSEEVTDPGEPPLKGPAPQQQQQQQQQQPPAQTPYPVPPGNSTNPNPPLNQAQPQQQQNPNGQPKTPEQLLRELQEQRRRNSTPDQNRPR